MVFVLKFSIINIRIRYYSNNLNIRSWTKVALRIVFVFVFANTIRSPLVRVCIVKCCFIVLWNHDLIYPQPILQNNVFYVADFEVSCQFLSISWSWSGIMLKKSLPCRHHWLISTTSTVTPVDQQIRMVIIKTEFTKIQMWIRAVFPWWWPPPPPPSSSLSLVITITILIIITILILMMLFRYCAHIPRDWITSCLSATIFKQRPHRESIQVFISSLLFLFLSFYDLFKFGFYNG